MPQHPAERSEQDTPQAGHAAPHDTAQEIAGLREQMGVFKRKQEAELGRVVQEMGSLRQRVEREGKQVQGQLARYGAAFASFASTLGQAQQALVAPPLEHMGAEAEGGGPATTPAGGEEEEQQSMQLMPCGSFSRDSQAEVLQQQQQQRRSAGKQPQPGQGGGVWQDAPGRTDAGPPQAKRARLQRGSREDSNAVSSQTDSPHPADAHRQIIVQVPHGREGEAAHHPVQAVAADGSAGSGTAATKAWKVESRAVSIVEDWLGEVVASPGPRAMQRAVQNASMGLHEAMLREQCPLSCVVAGFETALLECAASRGLGGSSTWSGSDITAATTSNAAIEEQAFTKVWCRAEALQGRAFSGLLLCAQRLDALLARSGSRVALQQEGLLDLLQRRLHLAAAQPLLQRAPAPLDTQACCGAAAATTLYRLQGNEQVGLPCIKPL